MVSLSHITISELQRLMHTTQMPTDSRLTVIFEDERGADELLKREKTRTP